MAILLDEPERHRFNQQIAADAVRLLSAATLVETAIVLTSRKGLRAQAELDLYVAKAALEIVPVRAEHAAIVCDAYRLYGKGRHPAGLNFGDVFAYALAKVTGEPLLFKGQDFAQTDIPALQGQRAHIDLGNHLDPILRKQWIRRDDRQVIDLGRRDNHAVARVGMHGWQYRRTQADIEIQHQHVEVVVDQDRCKPVRRRDWQIQLAFLDFDADFKATDRRDIY